MSKAFVKESDDAEDLPDRPVSPHRNLVTAAGLALIDETLARLYGEQTATDDPATKARIARDLRYWAARRRTAELVPPVEDDSEVRFGSTVTILRPDGRRQTWRIVGEDEADPAAGTLSYVSPVARGLLGGRVGDLVTAGPAEVEIVAIG
jgi:transcription elongation GreA/GreB family factor